MKNFKKYGLIILIFIVLMGVFLSFDSKKLTANIFMFEDSWQKFPRKSNNFQNNFSNLESENNTHKIFSQIYESWKNDFEFFIQGYLVEFIILQKPFTDFFIEITIDEKIVFSRKYKNFSDISDNMIQLQVFSEDIYTLKIYEDENKKNILHEQAAESVPFNRFSPDLDQDFSPDYNFGLTKLNDKKFLEIREILTDKNSSQEDIEKLWQRKINLKLLEICKKENTKISCPSL